MVLHLEDGRTVRQKWNASCTRTCVPSLQFQGMASVSESLSAYTDARFSECSSSHRYRGPQNPAQICPLTIHRPILLLSSDQHHLRADTGDTYQLHNRTRARHAVQAAL